MRDGEKALREPPERANGSDLLHASTREQAEERVLVLDSQGIRSTVVRGEAGYEIVLRDPSAEPRAQSSLALWQEENRKPARPRDPFPAPQNRGLDFAAAYAATFGLLLFHLALERMDGASALRRAGSANAYDIVNGEVWRVMTALTLHSDAAHVLANTLLGGLFLASLSGRIGAGIAIAGALATGALGNLANALYHQSGHNSIGASTAVFGVVGLLCGLEAWRRRRVALPWQGAWVPLGAGGALLAMLGAGGGDVDYGAHVCGLLAGVAVGFAAAPKVLPAPLAPRLQWLSAAIAFAALAAAWRLAV